MKIDILTLFPKMFDGPFADSICRIAQEKGLLAIRVHNLRDFSRDKHHKVDDRPFGGGPGMVIRPEPVFGAFEWLNARGARKARKIMLSPSGRRLDQKLADELARERHLVLLCGRYEGFDERIREGLRLEEISIGDYVLSGGEAAAIVIVDAVARLLPGAVGDPRSVEEESFASGLLEFPQYTRPREYRGMKVPEVLLSGDHGEIRRWREEKARERTFENRADLLGVTGSEGAAGSGEDVRKAEGLRRRNSRHSPKTEAKGKRRPRRSHASDS